MSSCGEEFSEAEECSDDCAGGGGESGRGGSSQGGDSGDGGTVGDAGESSAGAGEGGDGATGTGGAGTTGGTSGVGATGGDGGTAGNPNGGDGGNANGGAGRGGSGGTASGGVGGAGAGAGGAGGTIVVAGAAGISGAGTGGGTSNGTPSCRDLARTCGPTQSGDCCASSAVPAGSFNRFNNAGYPATIAGFRLDAYEITVGRFRKFMGSYPANKPAAGSGKNPNDASDPGWQEAWNSSPYLPSYGEITTALKSCGEFSTWTDAPSDNENRPLGCVSWYEVFAFCIWDGGRLPSEAEWSYAATGGSEQRTYAWSVPPSSSTIDPSYASYRSSANECLGDGQPACTVGDLVRVGSKPNGFGRWGHAELGGNVFELVRDTDGIPTVPCVNCARYDSSVTTRVQLGGSYAWDTGYIANSTRRGVQALERWADIGSRCARSP